MRRLAALAAALAALALPSAAHASQTLTVERIGTGTGTVVSSPAGINCGTTCSASFADNTAVTLTGASGANTAAVEWSGCDSVTIEHKCKVTLSEARKVTAAFNLLKRKLTVTKTGTGTGTVKSSPVGIECGEKCSSEYDNGTEVTLTGTSGANTEAVKWTGCTSVNGENKCLVSMSAAKAVTATFNLAKRELKVVKGGLGTGEVTSSPAGIKCGATCAFVFNEGQTITLTGTATGETEAVKWSGCDSLTAENKCVVTMNGAREVAALINVEGPTLQVMRIGSGTGTVTSSPAAIDCGPACAVNFHKNSSVTLTGTSGFHSEAVKWAGCDTVTLENKCLVAMNAARSVTATFDLQPQYIEYTVSVRLKGTGFGTVTSSPGGIDCGSDCTQTYVNRTRLTLIAKPAPGSVFDYWSGGSCSGTGPCEATIVSSRLITAHFVATGKRTLSVSKAGTGAGTVLSTPAGIDCGATCSSEVEAGAKVVLKASAQAGSTFTGWSGEGCAGTQTCKLMLNEARSVTATFAANPAPLPPKCVVPRLAGKTLAKARKALAAAHCALGKVRKPRGAKLSQLRVKSSTPAAGAILASGAKVALRLGRVKS